MTDAQYLSPADLAGRLNLTQRLRSWRGECPACAYANTFSVKAGKDGRPLLYCASCQDLPAIQAAVARRIGAPPAQAQAAAGQPDAAAAREKRQAGARRCWIGAASAVGSAAERYLSGRCIGSIANSVALLYRTDVSHPEHRGKWPAMIALVTAADGSFAAVHRTYLRADGSGKADATPDRASLGRYWGGAAQLANPLADPAAPQLVIGEGIESSASAGIMMNLPAWAALSAGNLASGLVLPPGVRSLVVAADHDPPGREAALAAARRWRAEGRTVRIATPDIPGHDFNDVLKRHADA